MGALDLIGADDGLIDRGLALVARNDVNLEQAAQHLAASRVDQALHLISMWSSAFCSPLSPDCDSTKTSVRAPKQKSIVL